MADAQPIFGVVVDPQGKPVEGARVYVTSSPGPMPDVAILTGPGGEFTLGVVAPGKYRIGAAADGFRSVETDYATGGAQLELRLNPEA